jgi:hypothetical protein
VQQREVAAVQIPAAALNLEMKTMYRKNRNLQQLLSISQISSSDGWERHYNEIKSLETVVCATCAVREGTLREVW